MIDREALEKRLANVSRLNLVSALFLVGGAALAIVGVFVSPWLFITGGACVVVACAAFEVIDHQIDDLRHEILDDEDEE